MNARAAKNHRESDDNTRVNKFNACKNIDELAILKIHKLYRKDINKKKSPCRKKNRPCRAGAEKLIIKVSPSLITRGIRVIATRYTSHLKRLKRLLARERVVQKCKK